MKVLHYTERWLDLSMGFVHEYVTHSRHPGVVVSRQARTNQTAFPTPRPVSLARAHSHRAVTIALGAIATAARADAVHVHFGYSAPDVEGLVRRTGLPLILSLHGHDVTATPREYPGFYERIIPYTSLVVSPSAWLAERIADLGFAAGNIAVVPSGVDTAFFTASELPAGPPIVAFVGRLVPKKGIDVLLEAWPSVRAAVPDARLHIVGDGPLADLVARADSSVKWDRPNVDDRRGQVRSLMRDATVVATPSHTGPDGDVESLLLVNLEAAASGRAVVTTNHGGIPEYVRDGETAIVVREADPAALAEGIVTVLRDRDLAERMAAAAVPWARRFDQASCVARRDDAVEGTLSPSRPVVRTPTVVASRRAATVRSPCSVVLPTRDRPEMLARALARLSDALGRDDELVVVDSASVDPAVGEVALAKGATVVRCELPGVNRARNAGYRVTTHDAVLYLDDDVTVDAGWADAMVAALEAHSEVGFVAGRIEVPDDQVAEGHPVALRTGEQSAVLTADTRGVLGHSASLAVRRSALDQVGGWDEALGAGGKFKSSPEVDLFDRLFAAGWVGRYEPAAMAWHDQWRGKADMVHLDWRYGYGAGARMAKLVRSDRQRAGRIATDVFWDRGLRQAAINARKGYKTAVLLNLAEVVGATMGLARALPVRVVAGHYVVKESRRRTPNR